MESLQEYFAQLQPGKISDTAELATLLAACWDEFSGDPGGMEGFKLLGRMEDVSWDPPELSFLIERHGGTALGSTRAELQRWSVNIQEKRATYVPAGHRQIHPMEPRVNVGPIVEEIVQLIVNRRQDARLKWYDDGRVQVQIGKVLPSKGVVLQTLAGRRKRFATKLRARLSAEGWSEVPHTLPHTYTQTPR